jgi:hypothetical protein
VAYSSTLKREVIYLSESSVEFQRAARFYIPEDSTLHNHCSQNLKSYIIALQVHFEITISLNFHSRFELEKFGNQLHGKKTALLSKGRILAKVEITVPTES